MFCTNCGAPVADTAKFCTNCGTALQRPAEPQQTAEPVFTEPAPVFTEPVYANPEPPVVEPAQPVFKPAAKPTVTFPAPRRYRGRLVLAVLACFLLFLPTGIPSIVFAAKAIRLSDEGNAADAARYAKRSTVWVLLSIVGNILWNLIGLALLIKKYG